MKTVNRILSAMLAVVIMAAMLVVPSSAAGEYTITVNGTATGHVYEAYQIFAARDVSAEGVLTDIEWGSGVNGIALLAALKGESLFGVDAANQFSACTDAESVSKVVANWSPDSAVLDRFAELAGENKTAAAGTSVEGADAVYTISNLDVGYYLVMDTTVPEGNLGDTYTKYIIRVVRDVEVSPKGTAPTVVKTVHSAVDGTFKEHEDITMTYSVYFKLEGTLPSNYATDYAQYSYKFVDTMPAGLTYNDIVSAFILHSTDATTPIDASKYTVNTSGSTITIDFGNLKTSLPALLASDKIVVKYSATLNEDAVIGGTGNVNSVVLHYSNDPNQAANVLNPNMGKTSADTASVYTYKLDVTKVDGIDATKTLAGAKFRLYRNDTDALGNTTKRYAVVTNGVLTASTTEPTTAGTDLVSDASGKFSVAGLDAGIYYLEEIEAPSGYNKMDDPVRVTITPQYSGSALTGMKFDVDGVPGSSSLTDGVVSIQVRNNAGSTLPSTGGMGTTLFYVVGAVLMLGALVVVMARKRESK